MIQLYLLILIIIFLLNYFYNEKRELFSNIIHASNISDGEGIRVFWRGDGDDVVVEGKITNYDYYLSITNVNNNITSIHAITPTKTNDIISYEWSNDGTILAPTPNTTYDLTITRIHTSSGTTLAYNTLRITKRDVDTADDTNINCNYNTVKSDFFNNLKGKKFNIYI
jgi:hypothetical protein